MIYPPDGRYMVQAKSEKGHRGRAEFEVEAEVKAASAPPQTVRVSMQ